MKEKDQNSKAESFDRIIRSFAAAVKNSALYPPGHPSLVESINSFSRGLGSWLESTDKLELGISPDNLLVNGQYIRKEGSDLYAEVGSYLHQRGLITVIFKRGITVGELGQFFSVVKCDPKVCAGSGGIAKNIPKSEHLAVREIDYSALLKGTRSGSAAKPQTDKDIWQSLVALSAGSAVDLPDSKVEFLDGFLRKPEKSAAVLNRVYKEALAKVDQKITVRKMRAAFAGMAKYFEGRVRAGPQPVHKDITDIILSLDPELIARLFEEDREGHGEADLSDELIKALPDDAIADFIASLVGKEGGVNTRFIKLFDKLVSDRARSSNISTLVGDKLLNISPADKGHILRLQGSFKDMLASNPDSRFLNEIYKMTIDTFADFTVSDVPNLDEYMRVAREAAEALKYDSLKRQEIRLLLNLVWLERSSRQFKKLCDMFINKFGGIIDVLSIRVVREAYELFTAKFDPKVKNDPEFKDVISTVLDIMMSEAALGKIVALIPEAGPAEMSNIKGILMMVKGAYPQKAEVLSASMFKDRDSRIVKQAIDVFAPKGPDDAAMFLGLLDEKLAHDIGESVIRKLLESRNSDLIELLFKKLQRRYLVKRYLTGAIKLCGDLKIKESYDSLNKIFMTRPLFYNKFIDSVRVASIVSLAQIGTPESMALVKRGVSDRCNAVRRMSVIILELDKGEKAA